MCPLIYKEFVLAFLVAFALLSLLVYVKGILLIPRGLDYGAMALLAICVLLSRRLVLNGSLFYRIPLLMGVGILFYLGSKLFYRGQYTLLSEPKDKSGLEALLGPGDEIKRGKENSLLLLAHPKENRREILAYLKAEAPRPTYYLILSLILLGICVYFYLG